MFFKPLYFYFRFPRDNSVKQQWISATGRGPDWWPTENNTICSTHFEEKCFQPFKKTRRLFQWAVPSLRLRLVYAPVCSQYFISIKLIH